MPPTNDNAGQQGQETVTELFERLSRMEDSELAELSKYEIGRRVEESLVARTIVTQRERQRRPRVKLGRFATL